YVHDVKTGCLLDWSDDRHPHHSCRLWLHLIPYKGSSESLIVGFSLSTGGKVAQLYPRTLVDSDISGSSLHRTRRGGPPCLPLIGNIPFVPRTHPHLIMAGSWREKYGPVVGLVLGPFKAIAVCGPEEVLEVLRREEFQGRPKTEFLKDRSFNKYLGKYSWSCVYTNISQM
ncbi:hypothetical protein C0J52_28308, partial [Blattella germanica]